VAAALVVLAFNLTFRLLWLDRLPGVNGDEAWYGVQVQRCIQGMPWSSRTPTGLPINPLLFSTEWLLLQFCEPSFWILRLPIVIWSAAGLALTYVLYQWVYGERSESLFLVCLTACLPAHVAYSRFCWDGSFAFVSFPLFIFPLLRMLQGHRGAVEVALLTLGSVLAVWAHATHAILVVTGLAVLAWEFRTAIRTCIRRRPITSTSLALTSVFIAVWIAEESRQSRVALESIMSCVQRLPQHLAGLAGVLVGPRVFSYLSGAPAPDWCAWVYLAFYLGAGWLFICTFRRGSSGDRKLVVVAVAVLVLVLMMGRMLRLHRSSYERYILYLVPLLALIVLRGLLALQWRNRSASIIGKPPSDRGGANDLAPQKTVPNFAMACPVAVLVVSIVCLIQFWRSYFQPLCHQTYSARLHRTFQSDIVEPKGAAAEAIRRRSASSPYPMPVYVEDWWLQHALDYLLDERWVVTIGVPPDEITDPAMVVGFTASPYVEQAVVAAGGRQSLREQIHLGTNGDSTILSLIVLDEAPTRRQVGAATPPAGSGERR
jgi:hypothetical protein